MAKDVFVAGGPLYLTRIYNMDCIFFGIAWVIIWLSAAALVWYEDDDLVTGLAGVSMLAVSLAYIIGLFGG